jgi:hypothetical protein
MNKVSNMSSSKATILLLLAVISLLYIPGSSAQQAYLGGGLNNVVREDDLDSYWLDTHNWYWYGFRPYTKLHLSRYAPGLPTWSAGSRAGYSFGINEPSGNAPWEGGPPEKFQLTKYGTWH